VAVLAFRWQILPIEVASECEIQISLSTLKITDPAALPGNTDPKQCVRLLHSPTKLAINYTAAALESSSDEDIMAFYGEHFAGQLRRNWIICRNPFDIIVRWVEIRAAFHKGWLCAAGCDYGKGDSILAIPSSTEPIKETRTSLACCQIMKLGVAEE